MAKPIVAIIGKPNVGKSTFFNYIVGKRISIVEDTPGVTRDRVYGEANWRGREFTLIDTGGIEPESNDEILVQMRTQANIAIDIADVIIFMTDIRQGTGISWVLKLTKVPSMSKNRAFIIRGSFILCAKLLKKAKIFRTFAHK